MSYDTSTLHANVYLDFQHPALLFQFILHELMQAQTLAQEVEQLLLDIEAETAHHHFDKQFLSQLNEMIVSLVSCTPAFPWETGRGALRKLCDFCRIFTVECHHSENSRQLHRLSQEALHQGTATHTWFIDHTTFGQPHEPSTLHRLKKHVRTLALRIKNMASIVPGLIQEVRHNENVILYLLRNKDRLLRLFGRAALARILKNLYGDDREGIHTYLEEKFKARGFDDLIPALNRSLRLAKA